MSAAITFTGQVGVGSIITLLTAILGFFTVLLELRRNREHISRVSDKVEEINTAVNGVAPGQNTLVQNVQELHSQIMPHEPDRRAGDTPAAGGGSMDTPPVPLRLAPAASSDDDGTGVA